MVVTMPFNILTAFTSLSMTTVNPDCEYYQNFETGKEYYIFNSEYPDNTTYQQHCAWHAESAPGTVIVLSCVEIAIPKSRNCAADKLAISLTGDTTLKNALFYCGKTAVTLQSQSNKLYAEFYSVSGPGRFICYATAMHASSSIVDPNKPNICDCGWKQQTRIVGGEESGENEYPAVAALLDPLTAEAFCGATIISNFYALTAAHCLNNKKENQLGLWVGVHNVSTDASSSVAKLLVISKFIPHPQYDNVTNLNDIAVIRTKTEIAFSGAIGPICLPFRFTEKSFLSSIVTALGWGFLDFIGPPSDTLQEVNLSVVSNSYCQNQLSETIYQTHLCTYTKDKDTCQSDSGGPLLWQDPTTKKLHLVGIVSFGFACASDKPAVNTRVTQYLSWILSATKDAVYCIR